MMDERKCVGVREYIRKSCVSLDVCGCVLMWVDFGTSEIRHKSAWEHACVCVRVCVCGCVCVCVCMWVCVCVCETERE